MGSRNILERFVWFDRQVRTQRYPNATKLAEHFEMSKKTAQRDIEFIRERIDCPLEYDQSQKGYFYGDDTFALPMIYLSTEELSALIMARNFLQDVTDGAIGKEISVIMEKINRILRRFAGGDENALDRSLSFRVIEHAPAPASTIRKILSACLRQQRVRFTYFSPMHNKTEERTVDPYHLLNYMGNWHLIGHCHLRDDLRDFNLIRMSDISVLNETFLWPRGFNIRKHLDASFGIFKSDNSDDVTLRFTPEKSHWVRGQIWHKDQVVTEHNDGSLELSFPVADFWEIKMEILKHGAGVEVIGPIELREMVRREAEKICHLYKICPPGA